MDSGQGPRQQQRFAKGSGQEGEGRAGRGLRVRELCVSSGFVLGVGELGEKTQVLQLLVGHPGWAEGRGVNGAAGREGLGWEEVSRYIFAATVDYCSRDIRCPLSVENPGKPLRESLRFEKTPKISESNTAGTTPNPRP